MGRSHPCRTALLSLKAVSFLVLLSPACAASAGSKTVKSEFPSGDKTLPELESVAGPIVKAVVDRLKDANTTDSADKKKTIAQIIDAALEQEFPEEKEEAIGKNYNETAKNSDATVETVIKVSQKQQQEEEDEDDVDAEGSSAANSTEKLLPNIQQDKSVNSKSKSSSKTPAPSGSKQQKAKGKKVDSHAEKEVDRIIDSQDNEYVLSKPKSSSLGLTLDPQLIRDLTVLITSSTVAGMALEAVKQPVINGYFIAGSLVGPGGAGLIKELVQVESLAQVGVQLLLFTLGLEFSLQKLRAVRSVALIGGMVEIFLFILVAGLLANFIGASVHEGIFVGALVSMSSTSIVVKCLEDSRSSNMAHGQITIGTLILQDCLVGLLFAFMPVLAHNANSKGGVDNMMVLRLLLKVTVTLGGCLLAAMALTRSVLPRSLRFLATHSSAELFQLTVLAFCLVSAWISGYLGLSSELGAFVAGVMLSSTDQQEHCLSQLTSIRHFFMSLFISTTGLVMSPRFLLQHLPVLAGGVLVCIICKTCLISGVVYMFRYPPQTALAVGLSMAQIGEFAFVLLSVASQLGLMPYQVYMLLMGVTALSLLITPFLMQASNKWLLLADPEAGTLTFKPPKLRKSGASSSDDGVANVLPVDSKEVHATARGGNNLAQRNTTQQNGNAMSSASTSQYPSETHVQQSRPQKRDMAANASKMTVFGRSLQAAFGKERLADIQERASVIYCTQIREQPVKRKQQARKQPVKKKQQAREQPVKKKQQAKQQLAAGSHSDAGDGDDNDSDDQDNDDNTGVSSANIASALRTAAPKVLADKTVESVIAHNIPNAIFTRLFPFQREGVRFGVKHEGRALLADEMGLGKTMQAICIAACYPEDWPLLIITPSSMRLVWLDALLQWLPEPLLNPDAITVIKTGKDIKSKLILTDTPPKHQVVITSYDLAQKMQGYEEHFGMVICDESHALKSHRTKRCQFVWPLVQRARRAVLISGTPAPSRPMELFPQIDMLLPGLLGDRDDFGERYCGHVKEEVRRGVYAWTGSSNLEELNAVLCQHLMIRRFKKDVLQDLPPKLRQRISIPVAAKHSREFNKLWAEMNRITSDSNLSTGRKKTLRDVQLQRLYCATGEAKIKRAVELIEAALEEGNKVIVFAHHLNVLDEIQHTLGKAHHAIRIDGSTSLESRKKAMDDFQTKPEVKLAILSITAAGVGITLTAAQCVIFAELYWNPGPLIQAEDRAHRIGQKSSVLIRYLIAPGSSDDIMWSLLDKKLQVVGKALDGNDDSYAGLQLDDDLIFDMHDPSHAE